MRGRPDALLPSYVKWGQTLNFLNFGIPATGADRF
jgi:hypothetical protein